MPHAPPITALHTPGPPRHLTPAEVPMADPWLAPDWLGLGGSNAWHNFKLYRDVHENQTPLQHLLTRDLPAQFWSEFWIALVIGSSEAHGHHTAWTPGEGDDRQSLVEPEFAARLHHAALLLARGVVQYVVISGGSPDRHHADYNEAMKGREEMVRLWGSAFSRSRFAEGDALGDRIIADKFARTPVASLRNCDRLCAWAGLDRCLVVTGERVVRSGWYFRNDFLADDLTLRHIRRDAGYPLGEFRALVPAAGQSAIGAPQPHEPARPAGNHFVCGTSLHSSLNTGRLLGDHRWT